MLAFHSVERITEKPLRTSTRHQSEDRAVGENELRHAKNMQPRRATQDCFIETRADLLVSHEDDEVRCRHTRQATAGALTRRE